MCRARINWTTHKRGQTACDLDAGCISRLADSVARSNRDPDGGPTKSDGEGAHFVRQIGSAHSAGYGRESCLYGGRRREEKRRGEKNRAVANRDCAEIR